MADVEASLARLDTFPKLLIRNARERGARTAFRHKDLGIWQQWSWAETLDEVRRFAMGLQGLGFERGERVAIIGTNRPRLYWTFTAVQALGGIPVPVHADAVAEELAFVLSHADVRHAVVQDQEQVDKLLLASDELPTLEHVIYDEPRGLRDYDHGRLHSFQDIQSKGDKRLAVSGGEAAFLDCVAVGDGDDISAILYTSGTTGQSKGVVLLAGRAVRAATGTVDFDRITERDEVLAYLPLAWAPDHYLNYAQGLVAGFCTSCPEGPETVRQNLREIGPSFYFAPPRVFEGLLTAVMIRMQDASKPKRWLFEHFLNIAKRYGEDLLDGRPVPFAGRMRYRLGEILIYGPLKNVLGFTNIRTAYTAGEAIGPDLFSFFRSLGINLKQLYGQTEAFVYITAQVDGDVRPDTVGPAAPDVDLRIADDGEVQYRSPGMFAGYFKDEAKTRETLTEDGFVMTGDAGIFVERGHLKIIDRAKDVGRLASGALFAPKFIENKLKFFPNIKEAVAFGDGRRQVCVFLNIDLDAVGNWAERNNLAYGSYQELAGHTRVYDLVAEHVDQVNRDLAAEPAMAGGQIARFLILHKELDPDDGELTRTQKVRRRFIAERYAPLIEALYDGSSKKHVVTEVTFEDGRKGRIEADVAIRDMALHPPAGGEALREAAE